MSQTAILQIVGLVIAGVASLVVARVTGAEARAAIKIGVCLVVSAVAAVVYGWGEYAAGSRDWMAMVMAGFGFAQLVYRTADAAYERATGSGLNRQEWAQPDQGLGA